MKKPHPMLLLNTIDAEHFSVEDAVYVGDSLGRDVFMAQQAGVLDVFAAYGAPTNYEQLSLLTRVTHWSEKEIIAQQRASECILPTIILHFAFGELLQHICFTNASEA